MALTCNALIMLIRDETVDEFDDNNIMCVKIQGKILKALYHPHPTYFLYFVES